MYRCSRKGDVIYDECWNCWLSEMSDKFKTRKCCVDVNAKKIDPINHKPEEEISGTSITDTTTRPGSSQI